MKSIAIAAMFFVASFNAIAAQPARALSEDPLQAKTEKPAIVQKEAPYNFKNDYLNEGYFEGNRDAAAPNPRTASKAEGKVKTN